MVRTHDDERRIFSAATDFLLSAPKGGQDAFLSLLILHLSMSARGSYKHQKSTYESAHDDMRSFNEMIQIVSNQLSESLMGGDASYDTSVFLTHLRDNARTPYSRV